MPSGIGGAGSPDRRRQAARRRRPHPGEQYLRLVRHTLRRADADGEIAGYAYAGPWRRKPAYSSTVEDSIFIAPAKAGFGIGRLLLTELMATCADAGSRQMIAGIADSDAEASVRLHKSCGFTEAGRLADVRYKHGRWIGTLLMQRALG